MHMRAARIVAPGQLFPEEGITHCYELHKRLELRETGEKRIQCFGETREISSAGVRFVSDTTINTGLHVVYWIYLSDPTPLICLRCTGRIVCSSRTPEGHFEVVVSMERHQFVRRQPPATMGGERHGLELRRGTTFGAEAHQ